MIKIVNLKRVKSNGNLRNAEVVGTLDPLDIVTVGDQAVITMHDSRHTGDPERRRAVLSGSKSDLKTFCEAILAELS